jgi:tryptophanyl-tRNA synthetase
MTIKKLEKKFKGKGYAEFKKSLADLLIQNLEHFRMKRKELLAREAFVEEILDQGTEKAKVLAQSTMEEIRKNMGLV